MAKPALPPSQVRGLHQGLPGCIWVLGKERQDLHFLWPLYSCKLTHSPSHLKGRPAVLQKEHPITPKTTSLSHKVLGLGWRPAGKLAAVSPLSGQPALKKQSGLGGREPALVVCSFYCLSGCAA